ncbi:hypothetical protein QPK87_36435 [Kamptonema cortianum]|nr:hypothetical protein [Kamptonema cortianum]
MEPTCGTEASRITTTSAALSSMETPMPMTAASTSETGRMVLRRCAGRKGSVLGGAG